MEKFNELIESLEDTNDWISMKYTNNVDDMGFINNIADNCVDFSLFENDILKIEGKYNKSSKKIAFTSGQLLEETQHLSKEERDFNLLERLNISFSTMNIIDLSTQLKNSEKIPKIILR